MFLAYSSSKDNRRTIHNVRYVPIEHRGGVNMLCNERTASVLQMEQRRQTFDWRQHESTQ